MIILQIFIILLGALWTFPSRGNVDETAKPSQFRVILGDMGAVASLISLIAMVLIFVLGN